MWRVAITADDEAVISMCLALDAHDPGQVPVTVQQISHTLTKLREEPGRGRAVVCQVESRLVGYALLISFWSNELGGEVCNIDELFIHQDHRGRGLATHLLEQLASAEPSLWFPRPAALALEVSPQNERARALYERRGFSGSNLMMSRRL